MSDHESIRRIPVPNGELAVLDVGHGPAVVLLHGGTLDHRMWAPQIAELKPHYRVIAIDARGHGASSTPNTAFRHADDVAAVLEQLDVASAYLVGLSMGASTAFDLAIAYPQYVAGIVASGAGTSKPEFEDPWVLDIFMTWHHAQEQGDAQKWLDAFLLFVAGPHRGLDQVDDATVALIRDLAQNTLREHVTARIPVLPEWVPDAGARVGEIRVPVLAIAGALDADDHIRMATETATTVPHGRTETIDNAAHYPNLEQPRQFNEALTRFLTEVVE